MAGVMAGPEDFPTTEERRLPDEREGCGAPFMIVAGGMVICVALAVVAVLT